jgi:hypothetical protein
MRQNSFRFFAATAIVSIATALVACSGSTGGGEDNGNGTGFDPDNAGSLSLTLNETDLQVAEASGFIVAVKDASGNGVPDIRVTCDTELGLALIEPSDGNQVTDGGGLVSGRVGCEQIGSFRMGCRLGVGAGKRQFATVTCRGPIPVGFDGFPNAGGGGLGGGSGEDPLTKEVSITGIAIFDQAQEVPSGESGYQSGFGDLGIDVSQLDCDPSPTVIEPEIFADTIIGFDVENNEATAINFSRSSFTVTNSDGSGTPFNSAEFALINADEVKGEDSTGKPGRTRFIGYMTKVGANSSNGKVLVGNSSALPFEDWVSNVTFRLYGVTSAGEEVTTTLRTSIAFGNYDRCG